MNRSNRAVEEVNSLRKSNSLNNLAELEAAASLSPPISKQDINQQQDGRSALMEKKKQQWMHDKETAEDWMFANGNNQHRDPRRRQPVEMSENRSDSQYQPEPPPARQQQQQQQRRATQKPPPVPKDYKEVLDEYKKIKSTIDAITQAENEIKKEQYKEMILKKNANQKETSTRDYQPSNPSSYIDQSRLPAAMRTSIMFGVSCQALV